MNFDVGLSSSSSAIRGNNDECLKLFQYAIFHPCYISPPGNLVIFMEDHGTDRPKSDPRPQ